MTLPTATGTGPAGSTRTNPLGTGRTMSRRALRMAVDAGGAALMPARELMTDLGFAAALTVMGLVGFRSVFGGWGWLVAGLAGVAMAAVIGFVSVSRRWTTLSVLLVSVLAFPLAAGVVLPGTAVAGILPTWESVRSLLRGSTAGWFDLLTVEPPVGDIGDLLAVPYFCGFVAVTTSIQLARFRRFPTPPIVPPALVSVASILFGTDQPVSVLVQGGLFLVVALAWLGVRTSRRRRVVVHTGGRQRLATAGLMLALVLPSAFVVHSALPSLGAPERVVLRDRTVPPFDPRSYPSPLSAFRRYTGEQGRDASVFSVRGLDDLDAPARLRLAVLDDYDGVVWNVSPAGGRSGYFEAVGERLADTDQPTREVTITATGYRGVWVPLLGSAETVRWSGSDAREKTEAFRFSRATGSAATPRFLAPGDEYVLGTAFVPEPSRDAATRAAFDLRHALDPPLDLPAIFRAKANEYTEGSEPTPFGRASRLEEKLRSGSFDDGFGSFPTKPGHSIAHLDQMLRDADAGGTIGMRNMQGDDEKYAALMALLARSIGMPARVVMGFDLAAPEPGAATPTRDVPGAAVVAWVEIAFAGVGWVAFDPTPPEDQVLRVKPTPVSKTATAAPQPPDPPPYLPPKDEQAERDEQTSEPPPGPSQPEAPAELSQVLLLALVVAAAILLPLLVVLGLANLVLWRKRRRRRRRRSRTDPAARVAEGWHELLDLARDLDQAIPVRATRREVVEQVSLGDSSQFPAAAELADVLTFADADPTAEDADRFWAIVDEEYGAAIDGLPRSARWRARLNLASLRRRGRS